LEIYQVTGIKVLKIIYPRDDAEIVAVMTGAAEAKLEYLVVTMAVVQDSNLHKEKVRQCETTATCIDRRLTS
jgi:hypothetical protein